MSDGLKIGEHIYNHTLFGDKCEFSPLNKINEFFSQIPEEVQKLWILDMSDEGYQTSYDQALVVSEQLGFSNSFQVRCTIANQENSYKASRKISFDDDRIIIENEAVLLESGNGGANFSGLLMAKTQNFLREYDKTREIKYKNEYSEIKTQAHSGLCGEIRTYGGYVWANQGFDFAAKYELSAIRGAFKEFVASHGVIIEEKDLKKFTKPCHFAAFGCGISAKDTEGNPIHLGKAFMLQQKWFGRWTTADPKSEEKRYAEAYNCPGEKPTARRRKAVEALGKSYRELLKKYYGKYASPKKVSRLNSILSQATQKWAELKFFNRD